MTRYDMPAKIGLAGVREVQLCSSFMMCLEPAVSCLKPWQHWQVLTISVPDCFGLADGSHGHRPCSGHHGPPGVHGLDQHWQPEQWHCQRCAACGCRQQLCLLHLRQLCNPGSWNLRQQQRSERRRHCWHCDWGGGWCGNHCCTCWPPSQAPQLPLSTASHWPTGELVNV